MKNKIGKRLSPILKEIEEIIWENEVHTSLPPEYDDNALRAATKIFISVLLDRSHKEKKLHENLSLDEMLKLAEYLGTATRDIIILGTGIDMHDEFNDNESMS